MPRPKNVPSYNLHKTSGQARVIVDGRHVYLGPHGSPESREKYARLIAEHFRPGAGGGSAVSAPAPTATVGGRDYPDLTVNELLLKFADFAQAYYVKDGRPTGEVANLNDAMRPLRALYEHAPARDFGPKSLKAVQHHMINEEKLCRNVINGRVNRIRRIFKWAVGEELIPPFVFEGLRAVAGLRFGRCDARETEPVGPVNDAWVDATIRFLAPQVADMVRLQRLTSMRPGDVVVMRPCDIDRSAAVWVYEPHEHKTRYLGRRRFVALGPKARAVVAKYLDGRGPQAYLFSPAEVAEWRKEKRRKERPARTTPLYPSEARRVEREKLASRRRERQRAPGERYDSNTYYRAIEYGIKRANKSGVRIPAWHPNQLRHSRATEVRRRYGLEAAQVVLGHAKADVTQVYAERNLDLAKRIARKTG